MEPRQVISGTEEEPRRSEEGQFLTSTRARSRRRIGALSSARLHHRPIKFISDTSSCLCRCFAALGERLGHSGCVGAAGCRLIVQNHALLHLYFFSLSTFIKNSSLDGDADMRVRVRRRTLKRAVAEIHKQFSNVTTSFDSSPPSVGKYSGDFSMSVMAPRQCKTKDGIFSGWGDIHESHLECHRCRKVKDAVFLSSHYHQPVLSFSIYLYCIYTKQVSRFSYPCTMYPAEFKKNKIEFLVLRLRSDLR